MNSIINSRPMVSDELLEKLSDIDAATVYEAMGKRGAMTHEIKPLDSNSYACGRALTVKCHPGDNLMLIKAVSMAQPNDVIVADMGPIIDNGPFGEVLAVECMMRKIAGLVLNCSVRDSQAIRKMGLPVFSAGISVFGTAKMTLGTINHQIICGGVAVHPGDIIIADADAVVVIPYDEAEWAYKVAMERREKEAVVMNRLRNGESLFDIYSYQKQFDACDKSK